MKAVILKNTGGPDQLTMVDLPVPEAGFDEVLIRTQAISLNPVDFQTRSGTGIYAKFKGVEPVILGWDVAGIVVHSNSPAFETGDHVFGMVNFPGVGNAYAEYVKAPAAHLTIIPDNITFNEAAATTLAALTAYQAFHKHGNLNPGMKCLIHAAAGGVGHFGVQLAKLAGAHVIGTSSAANRDFVLGLGADEHFDYHQGNFEDRYQQLDFVLDTVGKAYVKRSVVSLKKGGTLISIPGPIQDTDQKFASDNGVYAANILVHSNGHDMEQLASLLYQYHLKPHIDHVLSFDQIAEGHRLLESHRTVGKIIIEIN